MSTRRARRLGTIRCFELRQLGWAKGGQEGTGHFTIWEYDTGTLLSLESDP